MVSSETLPAVEAMREAFLAAQNDEIITVALELHDELVDRCENAADLAIESGDRDALNEAAVLADRVHAVIPTWPSARNNARSERTTQRLSRVRTQITEAVNDEREGIRGPAPAPRTRLLRRWKTVALGAFTDEALIEALAKAESEKLTAHVNGTPRGPGVWANYVANVLVGGTAAPNSSTRTTQGDVIRVGRRLSRLAKEGRVRIASKSYEPRRYEVAATAVPGVATAVEEPAEAEAERHDAASERRAS